MAMSDTAKLSTSNRVKAAAPVWGLEAPVRSIHLANRQQDFDLGPILTATSDMAGKCDRPEGNCCKNEIQEKRKLIDPDIVRDLIIGLSDGLTVPSALTAGLSSLGKSKLVYMGGLAEIVGGAFSMGIGGYLAAKADQDTFRHRYTEMTNRLDVACVSELDRDIHEILGPLGLQENVSRIVAAALSKAQYEVAARSESTLQARSWTDRIKTRPIPSQGTAAFVLKMGEGMEQVPNRRLFISAVTIGISYAIGGISPIIPYFFVPVAFDALKWSILGTGVALLLFGGLKSWFTGAALGLWGVAWGAISTLAVVGAAGGIAYGIVKAIDSSGMSYQ